nr:uncharacterized protein LOC109159432 [Ipomoea batatas]
MFSPNTPTEMRELVAGLFSVRVSTDLGRYLELPSFLERNKAVTFRSLEQKLKDRLDSWRLRDRLEKTMNRFWWESSGSGGGGIHWLSWSRMFMPKDCGGLGYKRIHEFNIALLAKQGWRLLSNPESLASRLLRARYYSLGNFLDAKLGSNPSGSGPADGGCSATYRGWCGDTDLGYAMDEDVVKDLFVATDVPSILATPVSPTSRYVWLWQGDVRGIYTVRHGYNLLTSASIHANPQVHFVEWRKLWKLPVPPKVENLLWRCMWNILPVRVLLRNRHVWDGRQGSSVQHSDCLAMLLNTALCSPSVKDFVHIAAKLWLVWNARNDAVWKGKFLRVDYLLRQVESLLDLWVSDYSRDVVVTAVAPGATSWSPLPIHRLKCNVDTALFEDGVGYGLVVKSHTGAFVSTHNARLDCGRDLYLAGAMAVKEALSWMKINGYSDFILESDSLNFCSSYNSNLVDLSYYTLQEKSRFATENRDRNNSVAI